MSNLSLCPALLTSNSLLNLTLIDIIRVLSEVLFNLSADDLSSDVLSFDGLSSDGLVRAQLQAYLMFRLESFIRGSAHEQKRFNFTYNMSQIHVKFP